MEKELTWSEFEKVDMRVGTIVAAFPFPEARKPAYQLHIDFGTEIGVLKSSAQITERHQLPHLVGIQVIAVVNFPSKKIGPFMSECLVLAATNEKGTATLLTPLLPVENGQCIR
jgi:tRNA-binding protein